MNDKDDGGKAFPWCGDLNETPTINLGMTLRDWFAGQALAGYFANSNAPHRGVADCADLVYRVADAMIAARSK